MKWSQGRQQHKEFCAHTQYYNGSATVATRCWYKVLLQCSAEAQDSIYEHLYSVPWLINEHYHDGNSGTWVTCRRHEYTWAAAKQCGVAEQSLGYSSCTLNGVV
jgi:hypothetical protein